MRQRTTPRPRRIGRRRFLRLGLGATGAFLVACFGTNEKEPAAVSAPTLAATASQRTQAARRMARIGLVAPSNRAGVEEVGQGHDPQDSENHEAFRRRLAELGYLDGKNVTVEYRYAAPSDFDRMTVFASELAKLPVDVIVGQGPAATPTIKGADGIPVVFVVAVDPVPGLVADMMRPGGNITGTTSLSTEDSAKRLPLLVQAFPGTRRVASLYYDFSDAGRHDFSAVSAAARQLGVAVDPYSALTPDRLVSALEAIGASGADGLLYFRGGPSPASSDPTIDGVIAWANARRMPAAYIFRYFADRGGLLAYQPDNLGSWRRGAERVAQILGGARPGDLPVGTAENLQLVVNLKTADALGLTIPQAVLQQAAEVLK